MHASLLLLTDAETAAAAAFSCICLARCMYVIKSGFMLRPSGRAGGETSDDGGITGASGVLVGGDASVGLCRLGALVGAELCDVIARLSCSSDATPPGAADSNCCSFCDSCATGSRDVGDVTACGDVGASSSCLMVLSMCDDSVLVAGACACVDAICAGGSEPLGSTCAAAERLSAAVRFSAEKKK